MQVQIVKALADNYIFVLQGDGAPEEAAVVDPGDAAPVTHYLRHAGKRMSAILVTHHHHDHVGGNRDLLARFPGTPVFGGAGDRGRLPGQTEYLKDDDRIAICGVQARVLEVPGHTKAHIAYFFAGSDEASGDLFSGDTVFGGTIGNLFEGTPEVMFQSIRKIRSLPPRTRIWCSHEYTLQYVREAASIDPRNARLAERLRKLEASATAHEPTVPLTLEEECTTNPFFRWDDPGLSAHLGTRPGIDTFLRLCEIT